MRDDVLSQAEVESLLSAVGKVDPVSIPREGFSSDAESAQVHEAREGQDSSQSERKNQEQKPNCHAIHESLCRKLGTAFSAFLRTIADVRLTNMDELTYGEFVRSLENPSCLNRIQAEPFASDFLLEIKPEILYPLIDRLLGGGREAPLTARRPFTEIERRLSTKIVEVFLEQLSAAWENVMPLTFSLEHVESNPHLVQLMSPHEVVVAVGMEVRLGEIRGKMNLCFARNAIEQIGSPRFPSCEGSSEDVEQRSTARKPSCHDFESPPLEMVVTLADSKISTGDLLALRVGDIITTEKLVEEPLEVAVQGVPKFSARPGAFQGYKAVRVEGLIEPGTEPDGLARRAEDPSC